MVKFLGVSVAKSEDCLFSLCLFTFCSLGLVLLSVNHKSRRMDRFCQLFLAPSLTKVVHLNPLHSPLSPYYRYQIFQKGRLRSSLSFKDNKEFSVSLENFLESEDSGDPL
ncbi:hypothetical protein L2E82_28929 [Cichorium intybus]|uniref:Uncharacterized protein n=1 Tax=Cichorium intybus TaxID=13427 RepID=A0ACB9CXF6_CICIN|nr:hypothetical protein L2E82_28929 [Cichorium intybus]